MGLLKDFSTPPARPLPVILLLDQSGSMRINSKIEVLNGSVARMIAQLAAEDAGLTEVHLAVIGFGGPEATLHAPLAPAGELQWTPLSADGLTPLGSALTLAAKMIEDREQIPSHAYRPMLVLVSDGLPNDRWREPLDTLRTGGRAAKAFRFALAIGEEADRYMLKEFVGDEGRVFEAHQVEDIRSFFRLVTMTVSAQSRSATPNLVPVLQTDLAVLEF